MTICIAAKCPDVSRLVFVSDTMMSSDYVSVEGSVKLKSIHTNGKWFSLFAGDADRFSLLAGRIKTSLSQTPNPTLDDVIESCTKAHGLELLRRIETEILLPFGLTREEFIEKGREYFGEVRFGYLVDQISQTDVGVDLLIAGYDGDGDQHIFELSANGHLMYQDQVGYHAIGNGRFSALGVLHVAPTFCWDLDLNKIIYRLLVAKFAAESAPGVGRGTYAFVVEPDGEYSVLFPWVVDTIRDVWMKDGQPPTPESALHLIQDNLDRGDAQQSQAAEPTA